MASFRRRKLSAKRDLATGHHEIVSPAWRAGNVVKAARPPSQTRRREWSDDALRFQCDRLLQDRRMQILSVLLATAMNSTFPPIPFPADDRREQ